VTNRESLEANKDRVVELFRDAIRAKIEQWDAEGDIENLIGEIDGADGALCDYAANCDAAGQVDTAFTKEEILETVRGLMQHPDDPVFVPPEE